MSGFILFNRKNAILTTGYNDFYFILNDFFGDGWMSKRRLLRDTFKIDIKEREHDYIIEAELPGVKKEEINLSVDSKTLSISVAREEDINPKKKDYVHKDRHVKSMYRRIRLGKARKIKIESMLNNGILSVIIPKDKDAADEYKISIKREDYTDE